MTDYNATRAAIAAGYSQRTAAQAGWEVLRNPKVAAEIGRRQKALADRYEISADNILSELSKIAFASPGDFYEVGAGGAFVLNLKALADPTKATAISAIEVTQTRDGRQVIKFRMADKRAALSDLAKHLGMFGAGPDVPKPPPQTEPPDIRRLAMATLALLSAASYQEGDEMPPLQIESQDDQGRRDDLALDEVDVAEIDLDDIDLDD